MAAANNIQIESNLYELLEYLHEIGAAENVSNTKKSFTGFRTDTSAWPYLTINKGSGISEEEIAALPGLVSDENYPSLLILGDGYSGFDDELAKAGFRKISFWSNMYLDISPAIDAQGKNVEVREVLPADIDAWISVVTAVLFPTKALDKSIFVAAYEGSRVKMFGAFLEGRLVGTLMVFLGTLPGLYMVAVDKEYRKKGIATNLVAYTIDYLRSKGYDILVLHSTVDGYSFYKSMGFNETGKMNLYYFINKR